MLLVLIVVAAALIFEFINGFHDTANAIATVVSTKVLSPRKAILLAAVTNLLGALWGTAVAKTIASGLVDASFVSPQTVLSALVGAIVWNLFTWWLGLPSSSSHALIGGLCGAALAASHNNLNAIIWSAGTADHWWLNKGILWKVVVPMFLSPLIGFFLSFTVMGLLMAFLRNARPRIVNSIFSKLQLISAASMGFMHGTNDAQKTMGIIALTLVAATQTGVFASLPPFLHFLMLPSAVSGGDLEIPIWIKVSCGLVMAAGTSVGGWKIIKTLGHKLVRLKPIHGFAAETSSSLVILASSQFGLPVSTTHTISSSIMGVGAAKHLNAIRWSVVEQMLWAWVLTLPCAATVSYICESLLR